MSSVSISDPPVAGRTISGRTRILAILGDPIEQVRTPELVNAEVARRGLDAVLVPLHVTAPGLATAVAGLRQMGNVAGAVVTMPHKQAVVGLLDGLSPTAREVGACNVIRFGADRRIRGDNTDGRALVTALAGAGGPPHGARVFLAGAGGAGVAIAFALVEAGATALAVYNRTRARAEALARSVRDRHPGTVVEVCGPDAGGADIVVNATPVGIDPTRRELPFDVTSVGPRSVLADIVISPRPTALVAAASADGATVVDGEDMLRAQVGAFVDAMLGEPSTPPGSRRVTDRKGGACRA